MQIEITLPSLESYDLLIFDQEGGTGTCVRVLGHLARLCIQLQVNAFGNAVSHLCIILLGKVRDLFGALDTITLEG